ncbi:MAG TPA: hypothetical protein P5096_02430 [Patescibacteria group bacterium]|nr:hypothetical protein [Patescibacteria group bacterium]
MKKNKIKLIIKGISFALFISIISFASLAKASFGITPPNIINANLLRGTQFDQKITVGSDNILSGSKVKFDINVPGINNWVSIDKGVEVPFPSGKNTLDVIVSIKIPMDAEYREYKGVVTASIMPPDIESGVALTVGGEINVDITVTPEKIKDFVVRSYNVPDISEGENLRLAIDIHNNGNVDIAPSKLTLDVYDSNDEETLVSSLESTKIENTVKPSEEGRVIAEVPTNTLKAGSYWANLKIFNDYKLVNEFKISIGISEKKEAGLAERVDNLGGLFSKIGLGWMDKQTMCMSIAVVVLAVIYFIIRSMRKRKEKKAKKTKNKK